MVEGCLTGVGGGLPGPQGGLSRADTPDIDPSLIICYNNANAKPPTGDTADGKAGSTAKRDAGLDEQSQSLRDFDAVQGRPPMQDQKRDRDTATASNQIPQKTDSDSGQAGGSPNTPEIDQRIDEHKADLQEKQTSLEGERDRLEGLIGADPSQVRTARHQPDLDRVNVQLSKNAERIEFMEKLTTPNPRTGETPTVLAFDPTNDGKIVVAHGDIQSATHVAVLVPGMTSDLDNIGQTIDEAGNLKDRLDQQYGTNSATVAWLDYDAPDGPLEVRSADQAIAAGPKLRTFINGMNAPESAEVTVFGHSYGSTVVGAAARSDEVLDVDRVVIMGSVGTLGDSVEGMNLPEGTKVFNMQNDGDYASKGGSRVLHGPVPPDGANCWDGIGEGHTDYFQNTDEIAEITMGQADARAVLCE